MSSTPPAGVVRRAVIAGHGEFATGMISAINQISGKGDAFRGISNRDMSAVALEEIMRATVLANGARVIFTDLPAGSCTIAARRVARDTPGVVVVTGTNLSVLLAWVLAPQDGLAACEHALERGRGAMTVLPGGLLTEGGGAH